MWKLNRITAENLCSFKHLEYSLRQGITTLVFGNNMDNETQRSNGSGKSALIEAIAFGITGSPLRKVRNEEIINDSEDTCKVVLELSNGALSEEFTIERIISRKEAAQVRCSIVRSGKRVTTNETLQPTVEAYNKYILEKLGLSKDEIYNNFILSKYKYQNFLSLGDREKKEIINAFSHANLVDQAIQSVVKDREPIERQLKEAELSVAALRGRLDMLEEQILSEEARQRESRTLLPQRIEEIKARIVDKLRKIDALEQEKVTITAYIGGIQESFGDIDAAESGEMSFEEEYKVLQNAVSRHSSSELTDCTEVMYEKREELAAIKQATFNLEQVASAAQEAFTKAKEAFAGIELERDRFCQEHQSRKAQLDNEVSVLSSTRQSVSDNRAALLRKREAVAGRIERIRVSLAGSVDCPMCGNRFLTAGSIEGLESELSDKIQEKDSVESLISEFDERLEELGLKEAGLYQRKREMSASVSEWDEQVSSYYRKSLAAEDDYRRLEQQVAQSRDEWAAIERAIYSQRERMFQEAQRLLYETERNYERELKSCEARVREEQGAVDSLQEIIVELSKTRESNTDALKLSLEEYTAKTTEAEKEKANLEKNLNRLVRQEEYFQQYKSFLANAKINSLNHVTNRFLEDIGSDIRLNLSGYTVLRSGKVRDKISVSVIRNGIDCGSFGKFSAGEVARVNLATILAMQKLINNNCESGKGLDLLVLDEILEAVDEEGLSVMFGALNRIGVTALVVSHGNIAEAYPHKLVVRKENGESTIEG